MNEPIESLIRRASILQQRGKRVMACLVVETRGSTPQDAGALMLVDDSTNTWGTIGGGCVEAEARDRALAMLLEGGSAVIEYRLDLEEQWDDGMVCGGTLVLALAPIPEPGELALITDDVEARRPTVLPLRVETDTGPMRYYLAVPPRERLYVIGAGHIGQALARLGMRIDFDVTLFDDRSELIDRFAPEGVRRRPGDVATQLAAAPIDASTCCVLLSRAPGLDERALMSILGRDARFVGMIGSRRKAKLLFDDLRERHGVSAAELEQVRIPVGLEIGAVTVEEIALSIAGQLIETRRANPKPVVEGPVTAAEHARR